MSYFAEPNILNMMHGSMKTSTQWIL